MHISYSKDKDERIKRYINFRIRSIIKKFCISNSESMKDMSETEKAEFISEKCEELICVEFWVKQKEKKSLQTKAA